MELLDQPPQALGHSIGSAPLQSFSAGLFDRGVFRQHRCPVVHLQTGGTFSPALNHEAQLLLRWTESLNTTLVSQFIMGARNVIADSRPDNRLGVDLGSGGGQ